MLVRRPILLFALAIAAFGTGCERKAKIDPNYIPSIEAWRQERYEELKKPDGWFSLAGLYWLKAGENRFGSDSSNAVDFPAGKAPARAGSLTVREGRVWVNVNRGVEITADGKPVKTMELHTDEKGDPTVLALGSLRFYVIKRGEQLGLRLKDMESPERARFTGIDHFPVDPAWRLPGRFERHDPAKKMSIVNSVGMILEQPSTGAVVFKQGPYEFRLDAIEEEGSDELFLIFADSTNGRETYGAGRFLYVPKPDSSGRLTVDFNKAQNPPCAFTTFATCPLPPEQNHLALRVTAGEKKYRDHAGAAH